jgi:hypothetical protein
VLSFFKAVIASPAALPCPPTDTTPGKRKMKINGKLTAIAAVSVGGVLFALGACGSPQHAKLTTSSSQTTKPAAAVTAAATQAPTPNVLACQAVAAWVTSGSQDTTPLADAAKMAADKNLVDTINIYAANYNVLVVTGGDTSAADPTGSLATACQAYGVTTGT